MKSGEGTIQTPDGVSLHYQWQRNCESHGVILIVHGIGEHIGRYLAMENWFNEQGFTCYGYDQRGHGKSSGPRTHVADFTEYVADLHQLTKLIQERESGLPIFIYAHSMGTVVALLAVLHDRDSYHGLILASPAISIGSSIPGWLLKIAALIGKLLPSKHVQSQIAPAFLSHDPEIIELYKRDTMVEDTVTLGWLSNMLAAQKEILRAAQTITVPMLVLHSRSDKIADIAGTRALVSRLPQNKFTYHEYDNAYHELHNEINEMRGPLLHDIKDWLEQQVTM